MQRTREGPWLLIAGWAREGHRLVCHNYMVPKKAPSRHYTQQIPTLKCAFYKFKVLLQTRWQMELQLIGNQFSNSYSSLDLQDTEKWHKKPTDHILNIMDECKFLRRHLFKVSWVHWTATSLQRDLMCVFKLSDFHQVSRITACPVGSGSSPDIKYPGRHMYRTRCSPEVPVSIII